MLGKRKWALIIALVLLGTLVIPATAQGPEPITPDNVDQVEELAAFEQDTICTATFSPDGKLLAVGGEDAVVLQAIATGAVLTTLPAGTESVRRIAFSVDGRLVAATSGPSVRVWDVDSGEELLLQRLDEFGHVDVATGVAFSPDGTLVATGAGCVFGIPGSASIKVLDTASGTLRLDIPAPSFVEGVAFSPDGKLLAGGVGDGTIRLWDAATGEELAALDGHTGPVRSVTFSPDGTRLASGSDDGTARLWDVASGKQLYLFDGNVGGVLDVAFSADGRLVVTAGGSHTLIFWDTSTGVAVASRDVGIEGNFVYSVAFNTDSTLLATCEHDEMLRLWGVTVGE